jgi:Pyruvate/2-oxoacid:ferredoxin oxidoreductase delta subunit
MGRPLWLVKIIKKAFPTRLWLAGVTKVPGIGRLVDYGLFWDDDIIYLPKDNVIQINEPINRPADTVLPSAVVEHFIREANHHWIMDFCLCREADHCHDYPRELGCLFLGEAVLKINPRLGRLVSEDEALDHLSRCRAAGLVHMIGRNKLDSVWLNVKPSEKLMTICNCCPCCCLWTMLPDIAPRIGTKINRMPGVSVSVSDRCTGCGTCTDGGCFVNAIHMADDHAVISEDCRGCGRCADECPHSAIEVHIADLDFVGNSIEKLTTLVDVT